MFTKEGDEGRSVSSSQSMLEDFWSSKGWNMGKREVEAGKPVMDRKHCGIGTP